MAIWLIKSEPDAYAFAQLQADGQTAWTGVRNFTARINLRAMKLGDDLLYYHSNEGKEIVGTAKVVKEAYPDPTAKDGDWVCVDVAPGFVLNKPVTLVQVKADPILSGMELVRQSRLSVSPVRQEEWDRVLELGGM
ncbi:EVE domain-containing protein [Nostoc sp. NIES-2111]